jgi:hypothetical protein
MAGSTTANATLFLFIFSFICLSHSKSWQIENSLGMEMGKELGDAQRRLTEAPKPKIEARM